jgi:hypothetical protein
MMDYDNPNFRPYPPARLSMDRSQEPKPSPLERFSKWVQLKVYQTEVHSSVYMFTPVERMIFCA